MANSAKFKVKGIDRVIEVDFDFETWRGDVLETLEEHLGGIGVFAWARNWADALNAGVRISEFRTRDLIGLVYLGAAQADPDTTWQSVARAIAPYSIEFLPNEPPAAAPPVQVGVSPDLGQQVPEPSPLAPAMPAVTQDQAFAYQYQSPADPPAGADLYRTP